VLAYAFCTAGLSLLLIRLTALEGRVDGLAPFLALVLCLLGGCFMDLGQLSAALEVFSWLTPPGLAVRATEGSQTALAVLLTEGIIWSGAGFLKPYAQ
jgi:ABC-type multidrug transport system permease subunit